MLNNKSKIKRRARRFFTQRACFSAVADCTSTISGASLFQSRVTTLPATLKTCSDLEDAAGIAKMTLKIGARMDHGLQKIIEKVYIARWKFRIRIRHWPQRWHIVSPAPPRPAPACPAPKMPRPVNFDPCPAPPRKKYLLPRPAPPRSKKMLPRSSLLGCTRPYWTVPGCTIQTRKIVLLSLS